MFNVDAQVKPGVFFSQGPVLEVPGELPKPLAGACKGGIIFEAIHRRGNNFSELFQRLIGSSKSS